MCHIPIDSRGAQHHELTTPSAKAIANGAVIICKKKKNELKFAKLFVTFLLCGLKVRIADTFRHFG